MYTKRLFDILLSFIGIVIFSPIIILCWLIATLDTCSNGFFFQKRVGLHGNIFNIVKIKTMRPIKGFDTNITQLTDPRITKSGIFFRKTKLDELPQLWNVLVGDMSFVGPRPDVPGYADKLEPSIQSILLSVRPGITGPASLAYRDEEHILSFQSDPKRYNDEVIFPHKVRINLIYIENIKLKTDIAYIFKTLFG